MGMLMYDLHIHLPRLIADRCRATGRTYQMRVADGLTGTQTSRAEEGSRVQSLSKQMDDGMERAEQKRKSSEVLEGQTRMESVRTSISEWALPDLRELVLDPADRP